MQITRNTHLEEITNNTAVLIHIADIELFPADAMVSCRAEEPSNLIIRKLFERRFNLMLLDNECLKKHDFRILSKSRIAGNKFSVFWVAKVQYLRDFHLPKQNIFIKKDQLCFFHGRFTFWQIGDVWQARIS